MRDLRMKRKSATTQTTSDVAATVATTGQGGSERAVGEIMGALLRRFRAFADIGDSTIPCSGLRNSRRFPVARSGRLIYHHTVTGLSPSRILGDIFWFRDRGVVIATGSSAGTRLVMRLLINHGVSHGIRQ